MTKPRSLVINSNFAGLSTANYVHTEVKDMANITFIYQDSLLVFIPKIPMQILVIINPILGLEFKFMDNSAEKKAGFIQAEFITIDPHTNTVFYQENKLGEHTICKVQYEYLVLALGNDSVYQKIIGFHESNYFVNDVFGSTRLSDYLHKEYQGGAIAISSDVIENEASETETTCDGPPMMMGFSLLDLEYKECSCFMSLFVNSNEEHCSKCMQKYRR